MLVDRVIDSKHCQQRRPRIARKPSPSTGSRDSKTILVIDDDHEIAKGAQLRLRGAGYHALTAADGNTGVAAALQHEPDAIVLDIRMPQMNGFSAMAQLRQNDNTKEIPIVMLSASVVDKQAALDAGARFFLSKPYQADKLLAAIDAAIQ